MSYQQIINIIQDNFPMLVGKIEEQDEGVSWSIEIEDESEIENLYDKLYSLESFFNNQGFELIMQDDAEYFGGAVYKKA